jgi:Raf kinase inhibitor-like YbhB/YbcL family protein
MKLVITTAALLVLATTAACGGGSTSKDATSLEDTKVAHDIQVTSSAFANNASIPRANTCAGSGTPPTITWGKLPPGTKSVAVVVDDPDAPKGPFVHWIVTGLPPKPGSVPVKESGVYELDNSGGTHGWTPPCPPAGQLHHYRFTVYALRDYVCSTGGDEVPSAGCSPPASAEGLQDIANSAFAKGAVVGTYLR